MVKTDSVLLSAARYAVRLCILPSAAVTLFVHALADSACFRSGRWDNVGYLVSEQSWLPGWGRREHAHYVLEAFLLCCSMCWGRHALKMGAPRTLG